MRMEIPAWVAVVVIVVVLLITAFVLWRGTSVQKQDLPPEQLPGEMMKKYGAPGFVPSQPPQPKR
ncbi:MAG: hypothetical protein HZLCBSQH_000883 [Candidatus Fervidibacterota bacterium]